METIDKEVISSEEQMLYKSENLVPIKFSDLEDKCKLYYSSEDKEVIPFEEQMLYKSENLVPIKFSDLEDKCKLYYSSEDNCVVLELDTNLVISTSSTLMSSKGDSVILSGTSGKGNIHLNPTRIKNSEVLEKKVSEETG